MSRTPGASAVAAAGRRPPAARPGAAVGFTIRDQISAHGYQPPDPLRPQGGDDVCRLRSPVVAGKDRLIDPQGIHQTMMSRANTEWALGRACFGVSNIQDAGPDLLLSAERRFLCRLFRSAVCRRQVVVVVAGHGRGAGREKGCCRSRGRSLSYGLPEGSPADHLHTSRAAEVSRHSGSSLWNARNSLPGAAPVRTPITGTPGHRPSLRYCSKGPAALDASSRDMLGVISGGGAAVLRARRTRRCNCSIQQQEQQLAGVPVEVQLDAPISTMA